MTRFSMQYGTQTRKSASGQPFDEDYQLWLAGYWEDFTGAYALPEATSNDLTHTNTHFGNPMNAEARLNPHYRWSYADRIATYSGSTIYGGQVPNDIKHLHNLSMAEWLSIDFTRLGRGRDYVSKINNEYPDSHAHSNRFRFGGKGELDNYFSMSGSHSASGHYLINNGDIDSSFGRVAFERYDYDADAGLPTQLGSAGPVDGGEETYFEVDVSAQYNESGDDTIVRHTASAVTCGVFTTDTTQSDILTTSSWSSTQHAAHILGAEIKSPSRTPFLAIRHTMPATRRIDGMVDHQGSDGVWKYTGGKRELHHLRVGDIVQVGKHDEFCVVQEKNDGFITKLYSLSRDELLNVSKFDSGSGDFIEGGATAANVDIRKWFEPVITYDGDLNCVGDGDTFHLRFCPLAINQYGLPDDKRVAHYALRVGFDRTRLNITSNGNRYDLLNNDYHPSHSKAAIEVELQLHPTTESQKIDHGINQVRISTLDTSIRTDHKQAFIDYDATSTVTAPNYTNEWEHWVDVDVVMDFTNQRYKVYVDGYEAGTFNFETKPSGGNWAGTDLFGWHLDHAALQKDGEYTPDNGTNEYALTAGKYWGSEAKRTATLYTLIDRVGLVNEITNPIRNSPNTVVSASDIQVEEISWKQGLNEASRLNATLIDDDNERQIQDIFTNYPAEWMILFFKNGIDSPYWTGFLETIKVQQNKKSKSKKINIIARDCVGKMDGIMPYWDVGQEETKAPSTAYTYRREESLGISENFYFGARALLRGQATLGLDHQTRAAHPQASTTEIGAIQGYYAARYDQRTRLYSGNSIQMYVGQDDYGPSVDPDIYNTTATPQDSDKNIWRMWSTKKIIGFSDGSFHGGKYIIAHCIEHGLVVDDEFKIYGEEIGNAFTVQAGGGTDGLDIVVKKILDDNHFCFEYKSTVGSIFGRLGDEPGHFWSVVTRDNDDFGLGLALPSGSVESAMQFENKHNRGLSAIENPDHSLSAMGRIDAFDGRQWRALNSGLAFSFVQASGGAGGTVSTFNYSPNVVDSDFNSDTTNDSRISSVLSQGMMESTATSLPIVATTEQSTNWNGWASYNFKPCGILPLETGVPKYVSHDALVTVGPRGSFPKGSQLISSAPLYNKSAALEYLNWDTATERSQIMTITDIYKQFNLTAAHYGGGFESYLVGTTDPNHTILIRGNDIDQIEPKNLSTSAVSHTINYPQQGRAPVFAKWTNAKTTTVSATGSGPWEITLPSAGFKLIPYSGIATIDTGGSVASLIRWTGKNESTNKLTGVTVLTAGSAGIDSSGGQAFNPKIFPVVCSAQAVFRHPRPPREEYRVAHASYMHDIAASPWFRMVFGIIEPYAAGTHGPPYWASARTGNRVVAGPGWGAGSYGVDGEWNFENPLTNNEATELYGESAQYSDTFTLTADYDPATDTSFTISGGTPPLIDENMKDRRWIDRGSRVYDNGTDPLISIPSRAWAPSNKQAMNNGCLVFEIENTDGSIDVGAARSAQMTTCADTTDENFTHWEISRIRQSEIQNMIQHGEVTLPGVSTTQRMPGPIWLWAAQNPSGWLSGAETMHDADDLKDEDFFHSGNPAAVDGSRLFTSLSVGDIIFVGNTQGSLGDMPVTNEVNEEFNPDNPHGEDRDLVSYRWYKVIDKRSDEKAIAIFPAEYAYCNHIEDLKHPVGMGITTENTTSSFLGWKHKLVRATGTTNPYNGNQPSGFPNTNKAICKVYSGNIQVSGVKHLINGHKAGTKGRFRYIRNNFNHIWLNWADMRNDGSADADGGFRTTEFGLIYPTSDEYDIQLVFSQTQANITSMKIGDDVDMWELTGTDPFTGAAWSANYSNKQNLTHLQSWESKAGAPMVCDLSKFFNLNTMANNGRIGQESGGTKIVSDYEITVAGEAVLLDNYWWQAGPTPYTAKYRNPYDPNYQFYCRYETKLMQDTHRHPTMLIDSSNVYQGAAFPSFKGAGIVEAKAENAGTDEVDTYTFKMGGCFVTHYDELASGIATRLYLGVGSNKVEDGDIASTMENTEWFDNTDLMGLSKDSEHTVFSSWAPPSSLGAMLAIEGHVASKGSNTYFLDDQIRMIWQTHRVQCWLSGTEVPCNYDINNVPVTKDMDYGQQGGAGSIDSYGTLFDGRGKTTLGLIRGIRAAAGQGDLGNFTAFNYLVGRNNRFEFRPTYGSGLTIDRDTLSRSDISSEARGQFTHVRTIYNGGASFVDVPTPILDGSSARFKILPALDTASDREAEALGSRELQRINDSAVKVDCELIGDQTNPNSSLDGGLFGYICTPFVQNNAGVATNNHGAFVHSGNLGGHIIGGRLNAMDGNLDATNGSSIGSQRSMEYLESGRGYHGGGGCNTYDTHETNFSGQFTPYGICSIEKAVQVVHIPKGVPKVSDTTGQKLRIFITHNSNVANEGKFRIWLVDSHFDSQRRQDSSNALTAAKIAYVDVQANGFVEIPFPTSYGAGSLKMVLSFNREYCIDLLKYRSNNSTESKSNKGNRVTTLADTAVTILDLTSNSSVNESSAFPLGLPLFYRPLGSEDSQGRQGPLWQIRPRSLYYAPQIEIVDDFVWRPGRTVTYTDSVLNLNENLTIMEVEWSQKEQRIERTVLRLKKDESQGTHLFGLGGQMPKPIAPGRPPETGDEGGDSGGGIHGLPVLPGDDFRDDWAPGWGGLTPPDRGGVGGGHTISPAKTSGARHHSISGAPDQQGGAGQGATMTGGRVSINRLSKGTANVLKGGGEVIASRRSKKTKRVSSKEAIGQTKTTGSGSAVFGASGFTLPGVSQIPDGGIAQADYHEGSVIITVPQAVSNDRIKVAVNVLAPTTGGGTKYTLFTTMECIETGFRQRKAVHITANDESQRVTLFSARNVEGAGTLGNRIKVTMGRVPGGGLLSTKDGLDDSPFASLLVKGVEIQFSEDVKDKSLGRLTSEERVENKDNTKGWMTETSERWRSGTSDADFDTAGNVTYSRRGRAASNKLRMPDGSGGYSEDEVG